MLRAFQGSSSALCCCLFACCADADKMSADNCFIWLCCWRGSFVGSTPRTSSSPAPTPSSLKSTSVSTLMPAFKVFTTLVYLGSSSNLMKPLKSVRQHRHHQNGAEAKAERWRNVTETFYVAYKKRCIFKPFVCVFVCVYVSECACLCVCELKRCSNCNCWWRQSTTSAVCCLQLLLRHQHQLELLESCLRLPALPANCDCQVPWVINATIYMMPDTMRTCCCWLLKPER